MSKFKKGDVVNLLGWEAFGDGRLHWSIAKDFLYSIGLVESTRGDSCSVTIYDMGYDLTRTYCLDDTALNKIGVL